METLNGLIAGTKYEGHSLEGIVTASRDSGDTAIFNNAAQIWNHDFYWRSLAPAGKGGEPSAELKSAINAAFGSLDSCKAALADAAVKRFGSGWTWLLVKDAKLAVGRKVEDVIALLKGIPCRNGTSCPDQLARALETEIAR